MTQETKWVAAYRAWGETAKVRRAAETALREALAVEMAAKASLLEVWHARAGTGIGGAS